MKTIVWRPGTPPSLLRPTTVQQGRPISGTTVAAGRTLDGELQVSLPDTLLVADAGDVYNQILVWGGACELVVDTSIAPAVIPAGMVLPGFGVDPVTNAAKTSGDPLLTIRGAGPFTALLVKDTARILGALSLTDMDITCEARTVIPMAIGMSFSARRTAIRNVAGALVPVVVTPDSSDPSLSFTEGVFLANAVVAHPIFQFGTTGGDPGGQVAIRISMGYSQGVNAIRSSNLATTAYQVFHDGSIANGYFGAQNPLIAGAVTDNSYGNGTAAALYTPAVPGDWAGAAPTTVQGALDRIAADLAANLALGGGGAPIP